MFPEIKTGGVTTPATIGIPSLSTAPPSLSSFFNFPAPTPPASVATPPKVVDTSTVKNLSSLNTTGLAAQAVQQPTGLDLNNATEQQINAMFGAGAATKFKIGKNATGNYVVTPDIFKAYSDSVNSNAIVSSSNSVVNQEKTVADTVKSMTPPEDGTKGAKDASDKYLSLLDEQMTALAKRREDEVKGIEADFASQADKLATAQKNEVGSTTSTLARIGGFLGPSASATGALLNLGAQHKSEVLALEAKKQSAIQAAKTAIQDKEFALARMKVQEVKDIEENIYKRKQDFFDNTIKVQDQQMQTDKEMRDKYKDDLAALSTVDPTTVPPEKLDEIDRFYGVKGFTKKYLEVSSAAAKAKSQQEVLDSQQKLLNLLQDIPQGQSVKFPDGTEYTGMGSVSDIATYMQTDSNGIAHLVTYNKATKKLGVTTIGAIGKGSSNGRSSQGGVAGVDPVTVDNIKNRAQIILEQSKDGKYYDPDVYMGVREELKTKYPQLLTYVDGIFLNKSNGFFSSDGIKRLRSKGVVYDAQALAGVFGQQTTDTSTPEDTGTQSEDDQP